MISPTDAEIDNLLLYLHNVAYHASPYHGLDLWPVEKREPLRSAVREWLSGLQPESQR